MTTEFDEFSAMRDSGVPAVDAYRAATHKGLTEIAALRMLRLVYRLSVPDAKEAVVVANGYAKSLSEHQEALVTAIEQAFKDDSDP